MSALLNTAGSRAQPAAYASASIMAEATKPRVKPLPASATIVAEDLEQALASFKRMFKVQEAESDDEPDGQDQPRPLAITNGGGGWSRDQPTPGRRASTAGSALPTAAPGRLGDSQLVAADPVLSRARALAAAANSAADSLSGLRQAPVQQDIHASQLHSKKDGKKRKEKQADVSMVSALHAMAESLDVSMLCMSRRLAAMSGDADTLKEATAKMNGVTHTAGAFALTDSSSDGEGNKENRAATVRKGVDKPWLAKNNTAPSMPSDSDAAANIESGSTGVLSDKPAPASPSKTAVSAGQPLPSSSPSRAASASSARDKAEWNDMRRQWVTMAMQDLERERQKLSGGASPGKATRWSVALPLGSLHNLAGDGKDNAPQSAFRSMRASLESRAIMNSTTRTGSDSTLPAAEGSSASPSTATIAAVGERLDSVRQSLRLPPAAWLDAVSAALRGDVEGTLAALEGRTSADAPAQQLPGVGTNEEAAPSRPPVPSMSSPVVRAPRLDLSLQPDGRLSPDLAASLKNRRASCAKPDSSSSSAADVPTAAPAQGPSGSFSTDSLAVVPVAMAVAASTADDTSSTEAGAASATAKPADGAAAGADPAVAALAAVGPQASSDVKDVLSSEGSASLAAAEAAAAAAAKFEAAAVSQAVALASTSAAMEGGAGAIPENHHQPSISSFIPLTAFIPPILKPRAIYGCDGRVSLIQGGALDPYQSLAASQHAISLSATKPPLAPGATAAVGSRRASMTAAAGDGLTEQATTAPQVQPQPPTLDFSAVHAQAVASAAAAASWKLPPYYGASGYSAHPPAPAPAAHRSSSPARDAHSALYHQLVSSPYSYQPGMEALVQQHAVAHQHAESVLQSQHQALQPQALTAQANSFSVPHTAAAPFASAAPASPGYAPSSMPAPQPQQVSVTSSSTPNLPPPMSNPFGHFGFGPEQQLHQQHSSQPQAPQSMAHSQHSAHLPASPPDPAAYPSYESLQNAYPTLSLPPSLPLLSSQSSSTHYAPPSSTSAASTAGADFYGSHHAPAAMTTAFFGRSGGRPAYISAEVDELLAAHSVIEARSASILGQHPSKLVIDAGAHARHLHSQQQLQPAPSTGVHAFPSTAPASQIPMNLPQVPTPTAESVEAQIATKRAQQALAQIHALKARMQG